MTFGGAFDFFPADMGKEDKYPLGLAVAGGGGVAGNFEDLFDLHFRDRFIFETAHRIAFQCKCSKIHISSLTVLFWCDIIKTALVMPTLTRAFLFNVENHV